MDTYILGEVRGILKVLAVVNIRVIIALVCLEGYGDQVKSDLLRLHLAIGKQILSKLQVIVKPGV